nr:hypothetical protein 10 [bacterium]
MDGAERLEKHIASKHYGFTTPEVKAFINYVLPHEDSKDIEYWTDEIFHSDFVEWFENEVLVVTGNDIDWLHDFIASQSWRLGWEKYYPSIELPYLQMLLQFKSRYDWLIEA